MKNFIVSSRINYVCIALSQSKFILPNLFIAINFSKCKKVLCFLCKGEKVSYSSFYEDEWFLDSSISAHFTLFESNFINITLDNHDQVETVNSKALLFIVASSTVLIEHKSLILRKRLLKLLYQNYG